MSEVKAGIGGEHYQPYAERTGGNPLCFLPVIFRQRA